MKHITKILVLCMVVTLFTGCFKKERYGTRMHIALYSQNVSSDPVTNTTSDIEAYAFWVKKGSKWEVSTWDDALEHRITNLENNGETLTNPNITGNYDPEAEYQLTFEIWDGEHCFLVIVDRTNKIYATRLYDSPMNLPEVWMQLHLYAHKKSGQANGWNVTNPFPDEEREPLVPQDDNNDETTDETVTE